MITLKEKEFFLTQFGDSGWLFPQAKNFPKITVAAALSWATYDKSGIIFPFFPNLGLLNARKFSPELLDKVGSVPYDEIEVRIIATAPITKPVFDLLSQFARQSIDTSMLGILMFTFLTSPQKIALFFDGGRLAIQSLFSSPESRRAVEEKRSAWT